MSYERYADKLEEILDTVAAAGFRGVEAEVCMLGRFYDNPARLAEALAARNLQLAALTLALPWRYEHETAEEHAEAERLLDYLGCFPQAKLVLVPLPEKNRSELEVRQRHALNCVNAVGRRAQERGIVSALHSNSPVGSVFRIQADYEVMFAGVIDHPALVRLLRKNGYPGWIMVEEESREAEQLPGQATMHNGTYMRVQWKKNRDEETNQ
jgi:inosose dehydratase